MFLIIILYILLFIDLYYLIMCQIYMWVNNVFFSLVDIIAF